MTRYWEVMGHFRKQMKKWLQIIHDELYYLVLAAYGFPYLPPTKVTIFDSNRGYLRPTSLKLAALSYFSAVKKVTFLSSLWTVNNKKFIPIVVFFSVCNRHFYLDFIHVHTVLMYQNLLIIIKIFSPMRIKHFSFSLDVEELPDAKQI